MQPRHAYRLGLCDARWALIESILTAGWANCGGLDITPPVRAA